MTLDQIQTIGQAIIEHRGYCEVPSASTPGKMYRVYVNSQLYSVSCQCFAGEHNQDCGHRLATDRFYDSRRQAQKRDEERTRYNNVAMSLAWE